jgi:hypothetical protein
MTIPIELLVLAIALVMGGIGWLIKILVSNVKELTQAINDFREAMAAMKEDSKNLNINCSAKHGVIDNRLTTHSAKIEAHGLLLAEHDVQIKELKNKIK